jgi:hypothetical protein
MPPVGFEPTISAGDRPQTYRAANAIGVLYISLCYLFFYVVLFPQLVI